MKLKKLEIIGFKSFLDKATINFPPGVSAVVGPNGCGKSNIVDALRWVMGEQSVKQLRGKNKEDIIFAGASGKAPTNMAEVSITLLNDNGNAPEAFKDYSEIMVTRRLYRSGESAYLINRQPCRLKDVHNIFIGSGMGARTYSVIGQGNIGAITDAGPDERRVFVEEAAGVTRYKVRKAETLAKIKSTNQNLLRVNDIVGEVQRQMEGLKRQARKAERYKNYQQQIKYYDSRLLCRYYDDMSRQIDKSTKLFQQLQDADLAHTSRIKKLDAAVEEVKLKRWEKNQEISSQKSQRFELQRKADRAETELSHFKEDNERLDEEVNDLESAREELEIKNERIELDIAQILEKITHLETEMAAVAAQLEKENNDSLTLRQALTRLNQDLDAHKNEMMQMVAEEARYRNSLQTTTTSKENLARRLRRMDEEALAAEQKQRALEQKVAAGKEDMARVKAEIEAYNRQAAALKTRLDEKSSLLAGHVKHAQALEHDRNKARSKLSALKKMAENFDWYRDGVKAIMKACRSEADRAQSLAAESTAITDHSSAPRLSAQVIGITADIIEAQPAYQVAVDAVLGEALQYIVVKDQNDGKQAIDYLQSTHSGRSGFIPMETVKPNGAAISKTVEPEKRLLHHIHVPAEFQPVAEALLGHVLVADTIDTAAAMVRDTPLPITAVTLAGEVVTPAGIMVGGSQDKLSGILAKKQELTTLKAQVAALDRDLEKARSRQTELEEALGITEIELQKTAEKKAETVLLETETEKELYRLSEDFKHARRHLNIIKLEQEQLLGEESDLDEELEKHNRLLAAIGAKVQAAEQNITTTTGKINEVSEKLEAFNQYTVDLKLKQTTFQADLENSRNTAKRLKEFQSDGLARFEQLSREVMQKREKQEALKQKTGLNHSLLTSVYQEIKAVDEALNTNESDFQAIDARLKENDDEIAKIQKQREETRKKIRVVELELSEKRVKRENIENRCEERYHVKIDALRRTIVAAEDPADPSDMPLSRMEAELARFKARLASIGDVHLGAIEEYRLLKERYDFLVTQRDDLVTAIEDLHKVIRRINKITQERFLATFNAVNDKLKEVFPKLFEGGAAWLELTDPNNLLESGVEYMVQPAGKKLTRMSLLSGGEKALSAIAFIFSIFLLKPASFCLMDEIDAPLDDANVFRFNQLLKIIGQNSQIVMITHNKRSMEFADTLFGITMEQRGISKVVSVNLQNN